MRVHLEESTGLMEEEETGETSDGKGEEEGEGEGYGGEEEG